jgi:hypothetical protein
MTFIRQTTCASTHGSDLRSCGTITVCAYVVYARFNIGSPFASAVVSACTCICFVCYTQVSTQLLNATVSGTCWCYRKALWHVDWCVSSLGSTCARTLLWGCTAKWSNIDSYMWSAWHSVMPRLSWCFIPYSFITLVENICFTLLTIHTWTKKQVAQEVPGKLKVEAQLQRNRCAV